MSTKFLEEDVETVYEILEDIGSGQYAQVFKAVKRYEDDETAYAVKCIDRKDTGADFQSVTDKEIEIMKAIDHPNCVSLFEIYQTDVQVQLVMELLEGRDLFERIMIRKKYTEANSKALMKQVCDGVKYLHEQKIIHRDLKPENILLVKDDKSAADDADTDCKVADFGLSKVFPEGVEVTQTICGTPGYVAPEILNRQPYGVKIDVWSIGVIAYITLCGFPPFPLDMTANAVTKVKNAEFSFPEPHWDGISDEAKDFISKLIVVDVEERLSMEDVVAHPWLTEQ